MIGKTTESFEKLFFKLPTQIQKRARRCLFMWSLNPAHPSLMFKKPFSGKPFWTIRIIQGYRAIGFVKDSVLYWFWIGNHDDYERLLSEL